MDGFGRRGIEFRDWNWRKWGCMELEIVKEGSLMGV